jgi:hypothetical protein
MRSLIVPRVFAVWSMGALLFGCTGTGCGDHERPHATQAPPRSAAPAFRLVAMTDVDGYLEPCGCQSRPLGGIDKAAAALRALGGDGVPLLLLSAGNLFFAPDAHAGALDPHSEQAAEQARAQAQTLAAIMGKLSLAAAAPGAADTTYGAGVLLGLAQRGGFPLVCGDAQPAVAMDVPGAAPAGAAQGPLCQPSLLVTRGGVRVGVWGLGGAGVDDEAAQASALLAEAKQRTAELRARGAEVVIGLWSGSVRTGRRIAGAVEGLSFLLQGGADSPDVVPPERVGHTMLLRASHRGQGLLVADVFASAKDDDKSAFTDVGAWARKAERDALQARIDELAGRIDAWKKDTSVDRAQLAEQEKRLTALRGDLEARNDAARPEGNVFSARWIELGPEAPSDPEIGAELDAHDKRVNEHNRQAFASVAPKPVPAGTPAYVGAERCGSCHESELAWWKGHAHGHAYRTLEARNKQFSLSCVGCHVTGYGQPGGAAVVQNAGLTDVGCESCHGPGSFHVKDADADEAKNVRRAVPESVCGACHTPEHSDRFDYAKYKARLIVPGHGLPAAQGEVKAP